MDRIVGIDLGTTNSLVATVDSGIPLVIADSAGRRLTPSIVHSSIQHGLLIGQPAAHLRVLSPAETIYSVKRFMGRRGGDLQPAERQVGYAVRANASQPAAIQLPDREWLPEQVSAEILKKLKRDAEAHFGEPVSRAVITVPAYFNDAQRNATKKAGELAGFTVERILNEPTAAALCYGLDRLGDKSRIAVYDLGGGTFDLSILELHEGVFQVLATSGNTLLGGDDLDQRLVEFLIAEVAKAGGPNCSKAPPLRAKLREAAEQAKIQLSSQEAVEIALPFLDRDFSFRRVLHRAELETMTRDIVERTRPHCLRALADARLEPAQLDQVILVGGQTRMPLVRQTVCEIFACSDFEGVSGQLRVGPSPPRASGPALNTSQNPDEAVALGAAIQAEILSGGMRHLLLLDVTPLSLGLETFGGLMNVLIPRNSTIPVKAGEVFTTATDQQRNMLIHVLQGERERAAQNWSLGKFEIEFEPLPRGAARIGVQFEIDTNGILHVLARDIRTGQEQIVEMKSSVDVDDAQVQQMIEESVEHAFEDLRLRQWVEAKQRALETIGATRKGLATHRTGMDSAHTEAIENSLSQVEAALATENRATGFGNLDQLKQSIVTLDEKTVTLAELMMEQLMDAMLRKKGLLKNP